MLNDSVTTPLKEGDDSSETTTLAAFQSAVAKYRFNSESPVKCEGGYLEQAAKSQASKSSGSRKHKNGEDEATTKKKKKRPKRGYAEPKHYAHLNKLPDILRHGLDVLFCGINPGEYSATVGHHFANPRNHFWRCLFEAGESLDM